MKTHLRILLVGLPALLFFSCTIEKRVHLPGYHIERTGHAAWKHKDVPHAQQQAEIQPEVTTQANVPEEEQQPLTVAQQVEPVISEQLSAVEANTPSDEELRPAATAPTPEMTPNQRTTQFKIRLPGSERSFREKSTHEESISRADSRNRAGLLLAPIRLVFTLLLIALVIVGVVLLFVLESALGGTVLLIAGAVLLVLILI